MKNLSKFLKEKPIAFLNLRLNLGWVSNLNHNSMKNLKRIVESFNHTARVSYLNAYFL